jgi:hypothetical protein
MLLFFILFISLYKSVDWLPNITVTSGQSHTISTIYPGHYFIVDLRLYFQAKYVITTTTTLTLSVMWNDMLELPWQISDEDPTLIIGTSICQLTSSESGFGGGGITFIDVNTTKISYKFASLGNAQVGIFVIGSYLINI